MGELTLRDLTLTLDVDGHLHVTALIAELDDGGEVAALTRLTAWVQQRYLEVLAHWTALHADVLQGVVAIGQAGVIGTATPGGVSVRVSDPGHLGEVEVEPDLLRSLLLVESCRRFIYSTTAQFRVLDRELRELRESAVGATVDQAECISIQANERIDNSRSARSRLEIAQQTIHSHLASHPGIADEVRRELVELVLVAEHMASVWAVKERNLEWVVQHVALRVGMAERRATRSFTAAVFAVAVISVMRDVIDSTLTADVISVSAHRLLITVLGCAAVVVASFLLYVFAKRFVR